MRALGHYFWNTFNLGVSSCTSWVLLENMFTHHLLLLSHWLWLLAGVRHSLVVHSGAPAALQSGRQRSPLLSYIVVVCVCACVHTCMYVVCICSQRWEEGVRCPGTRVTGGYKSPGCGCWELKYALLREHLQLLSPPSSSKNPNFTLALWVFKTKSPQTKLNTMLSLLRMAWNIWEKTKTLVATLWLD